jgi:DNA polymerase III subunit epsilon
VNFTAIDFETATSSTTSICQVGLVRVEDFKIVAEVNLLVQPPNNYYDYYNTKIHGINAQKTAESPVFKDIWHLIEPFISGQCLVAHDKKFEDKCIKDSLALAKLVVPKFDMMCTLKIYNKGLNKLCEEFGIELNHHDALSDAKACAELFMMYLRK